VYAFIVHIQGWTDMDREAIREDEIKGEKGERDRGNEREGEGG